MWKRLSNVKLSVFDPDLKKWIIHENMAVVICECWIYAVKSEHLHKVAKDVLEKNDEYKFIESEKEKKGLEEDYFNDLLDRCIISEELQGLIFSSNTLWRIQLENHPY